MSSHRKGPSSPTSMKGTFTSGENGDDRRGGPVTRYKGARLREWGSWVAEVRVPNSRERIWLGSYDTAEKAARAYDAAVLCLRGPHATFNFPDFLPEDVPPAGGGRLMPEQIREVAARHAVRAAALPPESQPTERAEEGSDVSVWLGNLEWPDDPLAGFPSPSWTVHYQEEVDGYSSEVSGGDSYSLWSFSSEDRPPLGSS